MSAKIVFIVDDSEMIREMASSALQAAGYTIVAMSNWQEFDAKLATIRPNLILMDVNMPETTGDFALPFFRESRDLTDLPILLYSDMDINDLQERAEFAGADGFVSKSWGLEGLIEAVSTRIGPAT